MHRPWSFDFEQVSGKAFPYVVIANLRGLSCPGHVIRLFITDHPQHAACLDALEEHGYGREVTLVFGNSLADGERYDYIVTSDDEGIIYLMPSDFQSGPPPDPKWIQSRPFHLILPW